MAHFIWYNVYDGNLSGEVIFSLHSKFYQALSLSKGILQLFPYIDSVNLYIGGVSMNEIWKDIEGYEGKYQISNKGRIKSLERLYKNRKCEEKILSPYKAKGYLKIALCSEGKRKTELMHRLVAKAFIPNLDNLPQVNHKDENRLNNCVENLEWTTNYRNMNYGLHNVRKCISLSIYYLKKDKPEELEMIETLENFRKKLKC